MRRFNMRFHIATACPRRSHERSRCHRIETETDQGAGVVAGRGKAWSTLVFSSAARADNPFTQLGDGVIERWNKSMAGSNQPYLPLETRHNRATYSRQAINRFNERPWGLLGYGKGYCDDHGNWQGFYAMVFKDSHMKWEPIAGYGSTWDWYTADRNWHVGLGYTAFFTAREDIMNYVPFPGILPLVSAGYKNLAVQGTYVPGRRGTGNVAFFWTQYTF